MAPAEVFATVELIVALPFSGRITAVTCAISAVRIIAPRLCGSCIWSSMIIKESELDDTFFNRSFSDRQVYSFNKATMP